MKIELSVDHHEGAEGAAWLDERGYEATVGRGTGSYVDGRWTASDTNATEILRRLWNEYCESCGT